jgi:hypothetical protein
MLFARGIPMNDKPLRVISSIGLFIGGVFGMAGTFASSASHRGLLWGIDGAALVMASALLAIGFHKRGKDVVASGFLVFLVGESVILSGAAMNLTASVPSFGAGVSMWAVALALISIPSVFPVIVRILGCIASVMFAVTAGQIFAGVQILPTSSPLPFYAYPFFIATFLGWIWTLFKIDAASTPIG